MFKLSTCLISKRFNYLKDTGLQILKISTFHISQFQNDAMRACYHFQCSEMVETINTLEISFKLHTKWNQDQQIARTSKIYKIVENNPGNHPKP